MPQITLGAEVVVALQLVVALLGAYLMAFWLSLMVWTYRDIRSRSQDVFTHLFAGALVLIFNIPGLLLYLLLRPPDTLAQAYERSLEDEALLQELDQQLACPSCRRRVQPDFLVCPSCRTQLKEPCPHCQRALKLGWKACPYCAVSLEEAAEVESRAGIR